MGKYGRGFRKGYRMGKEEEKPDNLVDNNDIKEADSVMGVDNLSQNIFDAMGAKSEDLKGAFGRPIDSSGRDVQYGGIGETKGAHNPAFVKRSH